MPGAIRIRSIVLLAALALPGVAAGAPDLGVPRNGLDRVLLDDGRVIEARVQPREGRVVPLEFPAGTLRVPRERVREVRRWEDFDPAPRDAAEEEKVARGFVRFDGALIPPEFAKKRRGKEIEERREERKAEAAAGRWGAARSRECGKFVVRSNAPEEERDYWCAVLRALSGKMLDTFPGDHRYKAVVVYLYRDEASRKVQSEKDEEELRFRRSYPMPYDADERVDIVLGDDTRDDLMPLVLGLSAIKLFDELMSWKSSDFGVWVRCGVPCYFAGAVYEKGTLRIGEVEDWFLFGFRRMMEKGELPSIDQVLSSGNTYWNDTVGDRVLRGRFHESFQESHVPYSWMLVHFLLHGERGRYRGGLTNWLRYWSSDRINDARVENSGSYENQRRLFLRYLKLKDLDPLVEDMKDYAAGLEYRTPEPHLALAEICLEERGDAEAALAHVEKAVALADGDAARLRRVGEACATMRGGEARAVEILRASLEADPLSFETHLALSKRLEGEEAEREARLAESLRGVAGTSAGGK